MPRALRLTLVQADLAMLEAAIESSGALSVALGGCAIAEGWEVFPEALPRARDLRAANPAGGRWGTRLFIVHEPRVLVGWGGFKGPPVDGTVGLGYSIAPGFRQRGLASDAVRQMLEDAFSDPLVEAVIAHTLGEPNASTRVLERAGFARDGDVPHDDFGPLWRWRHDRPTA